MFNSRVSWKYMPATWCLERTGWQASFICMMESPLPTAVVYLQYLSTVLFLTSYVSMDEARLVKDKTEGFCMYVPVHKSHEKSKSSHVSQHVVTSSFLAVSQSSEPIHSCRRSKSLKKQAANIYFILVTNSVLQQQLDVRGVFEALHTQTIYVNRIICFYLSMRFVHNKKNHHLSFKYLKVQEHISCSPSIVKLSFYCQI